MTSFQKLPLEKECGTCTGNGRGKIVRNQTHLVFQDGQIVFWMGWRDGWQLFRSLGRLLWREIQTRVHGIVMWGKRRVWWRSLCGSKETLTQEPQGLMCRGNCVEVLQIFCKGWNSDHLPFAYKQKKVMYLVCVVGTGYQQEEPCERVVGWTWKTGSISLWKGKKTVGKIRQKQFQYRERESEPYHSLPMLQLSLGPIPSEHSLLEKLRWNLLR